MDEQQILKQLNQLQDEVKPREQWVNMTKRELLNSQQQKAAATLISKAFAPLQKPALALAAISLIALVLSGAVFYSPQLVKVEEPMPQISRNSGPQLTASVEELSGNLEKINRELAKIKDSNDIEKIIPKLAVIEATALQGAKTATSVKEAKTLASLFYQTAEEAKTKSSQAIKGIIDKFEDNKQYLTETDKSRLEKAKKVYQEGNYQRAFLILKPLLSE